MPADYFAGLDRDSPPRLQLAALIDMSFLLLVFFLVSATLQRQEADLDLVLPGVRRDAPAAPAAAVQPMRLDVDDQGAIRVNGAALETRGAGGLADALLERLDRYVAVVSLAGGDPEAVVRCSGAAAEQRFIDVLNACRRAGIERIQLVE